MTRQRGGRHRGRAGRRCKGGTWPGRRGHRTVGARRPNAGRPRGRGVAERARGGGTRRRRSRFLRARARGRTTATQRRGGVALGGGGGGGGAQGAVAGLVPEETTATATDVPATLQARVAGAEAPRALTLPEPRRWLARGITRPAMRTPRPGGAVALPPMGEEPVVVGTVHGHPADLGAQGRAHSQQRGARAGPRG